MPVLIGSPPSDTQGCWQSRNGGGHPGSDQGWWWWWWWWAPGSVGVGRGWWGGLQAPTMHTMSMRSLIRRKA
eukprot:364690-Chlamydomonas_euryale.AAC.6